LAALDDETGKLYPIAKLGTGLTDNEFEKLT
jgi:ATP-dependent DNA ligase